MAGWETSVIAAIDQGTQSTRVYLFDKSFQPVASHQVTVTQHKPENGWIEHEPMALWQGVRECLSMSCRKAEEQLGNPVAVKAIGLTNQRETTVVWHRLTGLPLYNAIVWQDTRTSCLVDELSHRYGGKDCFRDVTGLPLSTYFSAVKFKWMYDNVEAVRHAVDTDQAMFGTVDSWLIYQMTGGGMSGSDCTPVHVTDVSNASRTLLMNLATCKWHEPYFDIFSIKPSVLPKIVSSSEIYGYVHEGPLKGVPISGCLGDQMAALLGQRCVPGEAKNTYGTGLFMMLNTGNQIIQSKHGLITTVGFQLGPTKDVCYALEGAIAVGGMGISWLRDNLGIIKGPEEVEALAGSVSNTNGVFFVPAFAGLLAPYWQDSARGAILGLTTFTNKAHIARAMLEAICYQTREVLDAMRMDADLSELVVMRVDGGCAKNDLLMQLQADILQTPVLRSEFTETTALGAALAAGLGCGIWTEEQVFCVHSYNNTEFHPNQSHFDTEVKYRAWKKAVLRSFDLADLRTEPLTRAGSGMLHSRGSLGGPHHGLPIPGKMSRQHSLLGQLLLQTAAEASRQGLIIGGVGSPPIASMLHAAGGSPPKASFLPGAERNEPEFRGSSEMGREKAADQRRSVDILSNGNVDFHALGTLPGYAPSHLRPSADQEAEREAIELQRIKKIEAMVAASTCPHTQLTAIREGGSSLTSLDEAFGSNQDFVSPFSTASTEVTLLGRESVDAHRSADS